MKTISPILCLLWLSLPLQLQAQLNEHFTDGEFKTNPRWIGDTALFKVRQEKLNSNYIYPGGRLPVNYSLSTASTPVKSTVWHFKLKTENTLKIKDLPDIEGNKLDTLLSFSYYCPKKSDILISEIFPDPTPSRGLPEIEFIELYNRSDYNITLTNWKICDKTRCAVFPPVSISSGAILLICDQGDENQLLPYGTAIGLNRFPSLNNGGDHLYLKDDNGQIISEVDYTNDSYQNENKDDGGYTLVLQYPDHPCLIKNWAASMSKTGGSPGNILPKEAEKQPHIKIKSLKIIDPSHLSITLNVRPQKKEVANAVFTLNNRNLKQIRQDSVHRNILQFTLQNPLQKSKRYSFKIEEFASCRLSPQPKNEIIFALTEQPQKGDIYINELLFNPIKRDAEFIELYNASNKIINLQALFLANKRNGSFYQIYPAATQAYYLLPGEYVAITENKKHLLSQYQPKFPKHILLSERVPSYPNSSGNAFLLDCTRSVLDQMSYTKDAQSTFFHNQDGVSLEKTYPSLSSEDISNWVSASSVSNFATPGYKNSQFTLPHQTKTYFKIKPETFSPDGDGLQELCELKYQLPPGYSAKIILFNEYGIPVRHLETNISLGTKGSIPWNGKDDKGEILPTGIYIFFINSYHPSGKTIVEKKPVVLVK